MLLLRKREGGGKREKETENKISGSDACYKENKAEHKDLECFRKVNMGTILAIK